MVFIDLTKAFDSVIRQGLWQVLRKIGCPEKFVKTIQSFHDNMQGQVIDDGEVSGLFDYCQWYQAGLYACSTAVLHLLFLDAICCFPEL